MKKSITKIILISLLIIAVLLFKYFKVDEYLSLDFFKSNYELILTVYGQHQLLSIFSFFVLYVICTALSLPGAAILTLVAGAIFGFYLGVILVSFASSIGATLAFLSSRFIFQDFVEKKFKQSLISINKGIEKEGGYYLFSLRLIPLFPFFVINLVLGLTKIKTWTFYWVSQLGMLAGTLVYVNAGLQIGKIENLQSLISFKLLGSFLLLGAFPFIAKKIVKSFKKYKIYSAFKKPKKFDFNMIVIGGGSAGLVTAYISSAVKAKVALIEKNKMGGDCLNTGCVPSKALLKSAKLAHQMKHADKYGLNATNQEINFLHVMDRVKKVIAAIAPHDSIERYEKLGVECFYGEAKILTPWQIEINGKVLTTKNITIATGASPYIPNLTGMDKIIPLTSENLWGLKKLPEKLVILGGGPIGCEMAQAFARLGSHVTLIEMMDSIMNITDFPVSDLMTERFREEGIDILTKHKALEIDIKNEKKNLIMEHEGKKVSVEFDDILVAIGRKPNINGFGLENLNIKLRENQSIDANPFMQTSYPNIYVCGDVTGPFQLTHVAAHQAWYCAVNALFGSIKNFKVDYKVIPWAIYTDPEVASVGLNEKNAKSQGIEYDLTTYQIDDLDRAIADSEALGLIRVLTKKGSDKILGATIVGSQAADLLLEFTAAMKHGFGLNKILSTIHPYPTMGEANKYVAGNWKKMQTSASTFKWLKKFHLWMRS